MEKNSYTANEFFTYVDHIHLSISRRHRSTLIGLFFAIIKLSFRSSYNQSHYSHFNGKSNAHRMSVTSKRPNTDMQKCHEVGAGRVVMLNTVSTSQCIFRTSAFIMQSFRDVSQLSAESDERPKHSVRNILPPDTVNHDKRNCR